MKKKKKSAKKSTPAACCVTPAFFSFFFFPHFWKTIELCRPLLFSAPLLFQSSFHTGGNDSSSFLFSFLFFSFHSLRCLRSPMMPARKIDTRTLPTSIRHCTKSFLSSVIFFGVTDNNMAYNRIGIMPVALQSSWHEVENFIMTHCCVCRSRIMMYKLMYYIN